MFLEDYRRKELCTRRQKNMDSAFESVYHTIQQGSFSRPSGTCTVESPFNVPEYKVFRHLMFSVTYPKSIILELNFLHVTLSSL
jgi:hypothetical protein